jgi:hypothetical protein
VRPIPPEDPRLAWPTLVLSDLDRYEIGMGMVHGVSPATPAAAGSPQRDPVGALGKGAILGLGLFGLAAGGWFTLGFWLADWHWAFLAVGLVISNLFIGFSRSVVVLALAGLVWERALIIQQPLALVGFVAGGSLLRALWEVFP